MLTKILKDKLQFISIRTQVMAQYLLVHRAALGDAPFRWFTEWGLRMPHTAHSGLESGSRVYPNLPRKAKANRNCPSAMTTLGSWALGPFPSAIYRVLFHPEICDWRDLAHLGILDLCFDPKSSRTGALEFVYVWYIYYKWAGFARENSTLYSAIHRRTFSLWMCLWWL